MSGELTLKMQPRIKQKLLSLAESSEGIRGRFRMAAGVVYKGRLISTGIAQYKTHPCMLNRAYREEQIYLHAEADALVKASKILSEDKLKQCTVYVVRIKQDGSEGLAKPCCGCMALISEMGIESVEYTLDD